MTTCAWYRGNPQSSFKQLDLPGTDSLGSNAKKCHNERPTARPFNRLSGNVSILSPCSGYPVRSGSLRTSHSPAQNITRLRTRYRYIVCMSSKKASGCLMQLSDLHVPNCRSLPVSDHRDRYQKYRYSGIDNIKFALFGYAGLKVRRAIKKLSATSSQ